MFGERIFVYLNFQSEAKYRRNSQENVDPNKIYNLVRNWLEMWIRQIIMEMVGGPTQ